MLADRHHYQLFIQTLAAQMLFDELAVVDQQRGRAFKCPPQQWQPLPRLRKAIVEDDQHRRCDEPAGHRGVGPHHGILHGVGDEQDDHEIERRHLAQLALARETQPDQNSRVYDNGAGDDAPTADLQAEHRSVRPDALVDVFGRTAQVHIAAARPLDD